MSTDASSKVRNVSASSGNAAIANTTSRSQQQRSEEMRARLLTAAVEVMRECGYAGFRTELVARAAGVSRGALLHHFPRKRDLILAVHKHLYQLDRNNSIEVAQATTDQSTIMDKMLKDAERFFLGDHFFSVLSIIVSANTEPDLKREILDASRNARLPIEAAWVDRMSEYMPRPLAEILVYMTFNVVRGYAMRTLWEDDPARYAEMIDTWKAMVAELLLREGIDCTIRIVGTKNC